MSELVLPGDPRVAFSHMTALGLAAVIEDAGWQGVRYWWADVDGGRPVVAADGIDWDAAAAVVHEHARVHAEDASWTADRIDGGETSPMSPRIRLRATVGEWSDLSGARSRIIEDAIERTAALDLAMIGGLGQPAYWRFSPQRQPLPDEGASRWEMKTRNRGEEFVRHRLHPLGLKVAARAHLVVREGLQGTAVLDEAGDGGTGSRTSTGMASPGPVDNALAWCALWAISLFPVVHLATRPSRTSGHLPAPRGVSWPRRGWFYLPVPRVPTSLARIRTTIASRSLVAAASVGLKDEESGGMETEVARRWLLDRRIGAVARFPIGEFGSASAPERRALIGELIKLGV